MIPEEFLGAFRAGHRHSSREFIDDAFSFKLLKRVLTDGCEESRTTLAYIAKFNNEFHKNVIKKGDPKALHHTDELRRDCYSRENARNRDVFNKCHLIKGDFDSKKSPRPILNIKKCS